MSERIDAYERFWPHYLSEHRSPTSRRLHFVGTSGFFASCVASAVLNPIGFPLAMAGFAALAKRGMAREPEGAPFGHVAAMIALPALASPLLFPAGVVFAYGCAWTGHFRFEKNRPATFEYPLWSLVSDFKMWGEMVRGRLWSGDPLEELGLSRPADDGPSAPAPLFGGNGAARAQA